MNWVKKGKIFEPGRNLWWNKTHAQVPVVDKVNGKMWRVYYASRSEESKSYSSYIEVEAGNPQNILYEHNEPILEHGSPGTFDDSGIMPSCIINYDNKKFLYYIGWTVKKTVPFHNSVGLAVSEDNGVTFKKMFEGPIIGTIRTEPYFSGTSYVLEENGKWKMWYLSCTKWEMIEGRQEPFYHIKYAESDDGINWKRNGVVAIDLKDDEGGIVSASVIRSGSGSYRMWYGYRKASNYRTDKSSSYRIGFAESSDGIEWLRKDEGSGIDISKEGWDSKMISYPYVIEDKGIKYMFYNGNGFGQTGFGYAVLNES